ADQLGLCTVKGDGAAGITASGQGELAIVCQIQCFIEIFGFGHRKDRTEDLFAEKAAARRDIDENSGGDVTGVWIIRHFSLPGEPYFLFSGFDDRQNALLSVTIDHRSDDVTRNFGWADAEGSRRSDEALEELVIMI